MESKNFSFTNLPKDVVFSIFVIYGANVLWKLRLVSKDIKNLVDDEAFWELVVRANFGDDGDVALSNNDRKSSNIDSWIRTFLPSEADTKFTAESKTWCNLFRMLDKLWKWSPKPILGTINPEKRVVLSNGRLRVSLNEDGTHPHAKGAAVMGSRIVLTEKNPFAMLSLKVTKLNNKEDARFGIVEYDPTNDLRDPSFLCSNPFNRPGNLNRNLCVDKDGVICYCKQTPIEVMKPWKEGDEITMAIRLFHKGSMKDKHDTMKVKVMFAIDGVKNAPIEFSLQSNKPTAELRPALSLNQGYELLVIVPDASQCIWDLE